MWLTTRAGAVKQRIMEKPVAESTEDIPSNVIINVLDGSWQEVYFRKQGTEQTPLCMKVYMGMLVVLCLFVVRSMFA